MNYNKELLWCINHLDSTMNSLRVMEEALLNDESHPDMDHSIVMSARSTVKSVEDLLIDLKREFEARK